MCYLSGAELALDLRLRCSKGPAGIVLQFCTHKTLHKLPAEHIWGKRILSFGSSSDRWERYVYESHPSNSHRLTMRDSSTWHASTKLGPSKRAATHPTVQEAAPGTDNQEVL